MVLSGGLKPKASPSQWSVIHTTVTAKGADSWVLGRAWRWAGLSLDPVSYVTG